MLNRQAQVGSLGGLAAAAAGDEARAAFISKVYGLLFITMLFAAGSAAFAFTPALLPLTKFLMSSPIIATVIYFGLAFGVQFVARVPVVGTVGLLSFGVFTGLWIAPLVFAVAQVNPAAVTNALLATGGIFGTMSVFGVVTKRDLSGLGSFLLPGLIAIIVLGLLNMFLLGSSLLSTAIAMVSVGLFAGYIAYDTQNIMQRYPLDAAVAAAMGLYLNVFIIFINLLRLFGGSRD